MITPFAIVVAGYLVQSTLAEQGRSFRAMQRLADRRLDVYDQVRIDLNRIYCYVEDVGTWKEETPESVIGYKRHVDTIMHTNRSLWSPETFEAYLFYMDAAYATYEGGVGKDARLRTTVLEKQVLDSWKDSWQERFTGKRDPAHKEKYSRMQNQISRDLMLAGVQATNDP